MIDSLQLWSEDPGDDSTFGLELLEAASSPEERESLIGELIFLDVERQRLLGKEPTEARYHALFPEDQDAASSHFAEAVLAFDSSKNSSAEIELGDRYEILEQIGEGGMGRVYRVRDTKLSRNLAIKVLRSDLKESNSIWRRFLREAKVLAGLQHPGIPPVHEVSETRDGSPFIAMKLVAGKSLAERMRDDGDQRERLLQIFESVCQTISYAHSEGVVHRDLKPSNVMIGEFGEVQVVDWGLAKLVNEEAGDVTEDFSIQTVDFAPESLLQTLHAGVLGTPRFMAPEQADAESSAISPATDIFALGAMLHEILTGKPRISAEKNSREILDDLGAGQIEVSETDLENCGIPELAEIARQALSPNPKDRPVSAETIADAVIEHRENAAKKLQIAETEAREQRRRKKLVIGFASAVVAVIALISIISIQKLKEREAISTTQAALATTISELEAVEQRRLADNFSYGESITMRRELLAKCEGLRTRLLDLGVDVDASIFSKILATIESDENFHALGVSVESVFFRAFRPEEDVGKDQDTVAGYKQAFAAHGFSYGESPIDKFANAILELPMNERSSIVDAIVHWWSLDQNSEWLGELVRAILNDPAQLEVIEAFQNGTPRDVGTALTDIDVRKYNPMLLVRACERAPGSEKNPKVQKVLYAISREFPDHAWVQLSLATLYENQGDYKSQRFHLLIAFALHQDAGVANNISKAFFYERNFDEGFAYLEKAIEIDPEFSTALLNYAIMSIGVKDFDKAAEMAKRALKTDTHSPALAHQLLVEAELGRNNCRECLEACEAMKAFPELTPLYHAARMLCFDELNQPEEATESARKFIGGGLPEGFPRREFYLTAGHLILASDAAARSDFQESRNHLNQAEITAKETPELMKVIRKKRSELPR